MKIRIYCEHCKTMTTAIGHKPYNNATFFYCDSCRTNIGYVDDE